MAKGKSRKRRAQAMSWCWYCDREFEDDKVLLLHQKAKHFKCSHCPRRLNTAGGLAVHIDQVHKLPTDKIENALPGRDSFDVEIYGMEGIPRDDLAEWKKRKAAELGAEGAAAAARPKRPKVDLGVIPADELAKQLAHHKALMSGALPPPAMPLGPLPMPNLGPPPPGLPGFPGALPGMPPGMPPLPAGLPMPPGGLPFPPPPGFPMSLPPGMPMPPPFMGAPPPGFPPLPGMPGMPPPPAARPGAFPPPAAAGPPQAGTAGAAVAAAVKESPRVASSSIQLKPGQMLLYGDNEVSPEEKRAQQAKYAVGAAEGAESNSGGRARAADFLST